MNKAISRTLWGVAFVGGLTVLGAGAANAADTSGEDGIASGNQIGILSELPVTIGGNAISILGDSESSGTVSQPATSPAVADAASTTSGEDAILGGNQVMPDVTAPVTVVGSAISVLGDTSSTGAVMSNGMTDGTTSTDPSAVTTGDDAIVGGNQVMPDATLPIVIGGNSISIIGDSTTDGAATSGATADGSTDGTPATTSGDDGIASGNQVAPDVDAPIVVSGNDVAVIRDDGFGDEGFAGDGLLDGILDDGLLDGITEDGVLNDGILNDGVINDGILDGLLQADPNLGDDVRQTPVIRGSQANGPLTSGAVMSEPFVDGPLIGAVELAVLSEAEAAVVADDTVVDTGTSPNLSPLMATAALSPAMMLAATGVEALPLIGGIALLLGAGIALVVSGRMTHAVC